MGKRTTLPYSDGIVEKNRASGFCMQLFNDTNKVMADVVIFHVCPEG